MEVMLLAAGLGSRLGSITQSTPKCLVEVAGKPILEWNLRKLESAGARNIVINLHYLTEQVADFLDSYTAQSMTSVQRSYEPELYNTGGGLRAAQKFFSGQKPILVMNADILCSVDLSALYSEHESDENIATLVTRRPEEPRVLIFDQPEGILTGWRNRGNGSEELLSSPSCSSQSPEERGFCGIQVVSPQISPYLGEPEEKRSLIAAYLDAKREDASVREFRADEAYWFDIGTPEQLQACRAYFEENFTLPV
jgi:MurNAc alpha-1-phosphate uridylyltransferase